MQVDQLSGRLETSPSRTPIVTIEDLRVEFKSRLGVGKALNGVSMTIYEGETLGVVGESGCGKSVTAQAILRIIPKPGQITGGSIRIRHRDDRGREEIIETTQLKENNTRLQTIRRKDISIIFQEPMTALSPVHTVGNQIIEKIRAASRVGPREARARAIDMLDKVGIPGAEQRIDAYSFELSGGMRQRAMIAMALANRPRLVIADEPTTATDVTIQAQIIRLLQSLQSEFGMAIMLITHDLGVVAAMADRIAIMYRGRVVETGSVHRIFKSPHHPYTQGLLRAIPGITGNPRDRLHTIEGVVPHPYARVPGCDFHPRCPAVMKDVCDRDVPGDVTVAPEHVVKCLLYGGGDEQ